MTNTPWTRFVLPQQYVATATGAPLVGAKLYFYASGTSDPLDTYADAKLSAANNNPVIADQSGRFPDIFLQEASYKVVLTDSTGAEIYTADPVAPYYPTVTVSENTVEIQLDVDALGNLPAVGIAGDIYCAFPCTLTKAVIQATTTGSLQLDVWAKPFVINTPPTATDSIVASAPPTLTDGNSSIDTTLNGWAVDIPADTWIRFYLNSISGISRFTCTLVATRTT